MQTAMELCRQHALELREGREFLRADLSHWQLFALLMENNCLADARRFLAHALPRRRALYWGCLCAWDGSRRQPPPILEEVLEAVCQYVECPTESQRRVVAELGQEAGFDSLAGCLAMAAFFSRGNVSLPGQPHVASGPSVSGKLVSAVVYLASVLHDPGGYQNRLRRYLALGLDVGRSRFRVPAAAGPGAFARLLEEAGFDRPAGLPANRLETACILADCW